MGDYTITLTIKKEQAIVWAKDKYNASLPEGSTPLTAKEYFMLRVNGFVDDYNIQKTREDAEVLKEAYKSADEATKTQVKQVLGIE